MNIDLPLILSIIGCITGVVSLVINFYKAFGERVKLKIQFIEDSCLYFNKLDTYQTYNTKLQGFINVIFINKSSQPITIYSIDSSCCGKNIFNSKCIDKELHLLTLDTPTKKTHKIYQLDNQITLPLKVEPYGVFNGFMFYPFLPDIATKKEEIKFMIKTSRKIFKESCWITKLDPQINDN